MVLARGCCQRIHIDNYSLLLLLISSTGYGASEKGKTALKAMLSSCSPGIAIVNIDNGFGAGYLAANINNNAYTNLGPPEANNPPSTM